MCCYQVNSVTTCVVKGVLPGVQLLTALGCCQVCSVTVVNGIGMLPGVKLLTAWDVARCAVVN